MTLLQRKQIGSQASSNLNISSLARKYHCTRDTARCWLSRGAEERPTYQDRAGRGRKSKLPPKVKKSIRKKAKRGHTTAKLAEYVSEQYGIEVTRQTVAAALRATKHLMWLPVSRGKCLREGNQQLRVKFCQKNRNARFKTWVFVDAKDLYIYYDPLGFARWRWQDPKKRAAFPVSRARPWVFRFYAAVAHNHKSALYFVPPTPPEGSAAHAGKGSYNSDAFIEMMGQLAEEVLAWFPRRRSYIVMDHARSSM